MAALTQQQWFERLKGFLPTWFFEDEKYNVAHFQALAKILANAQADSNDHVAMTFIENATGEFLAEHGAERSVTQESGESVASYRARIRIISDTVTQSKIQAAIDSVLNNGPAFLIENFSYGFMDDVDNEAFFDDEGMIWLDGKKVYNWFTVVIPVQVAGDQDAIRAAIISVIEGNKALGVTYDVAYRTA